jgi:hypothetical protein
MATKKTASKRAASAPPPDTTRAIDAETAETPGTPEEAQEQGKAIDEIRAEGMGAAAAREVAGDDPAARGSGVPGTVTTEPTGPADTEDAADEAVNYIHDDATRNTADLRKAALRRAKGGQ